MVDTQRTKAALASLFADNVTGDISEQDLRDFLETMHASYGGMYISTPAETSISTVSSGGITGDNYVKAAGTTTAGLINRFDMPTNNRLRYTGTPQIIVKVAAFASMTTASNNTVVGIKIGQNGTPADKTYIRRKTGTGSDVGAFAIGGLFQMNTNDYLELFVANETDNSNITIQSMDLIAQGLME